MNAQARDEELLAALLHFTLNHPSPDVARFHDALRNRGDTYEPVTPCMLAAAGLMETSVAGSTGEEKRLLQTFSRHGDHLRWEQSYRKTDGLVLDAMLDAYGFVEVIGARGPFVSERIRAGIGVWGPSIDYPRHHHQAEEVYILLAGSASFRLGDRDESDRYAGDAVYVESNLPHAFSSGTEGLTVCYLWQAGDLRQISSFD